MIDLRDIAKIWPISSPKLPTSTLKFGPSKTENTEVPVITQSLMGIIKDIDENDYKRHLEEKYL